MKTLKQFINDQFINEALFDLRDYDRVVREVITPKDKYELIKIIEDTIKKEGNKCNLNFIDTSKITDMSYIFYNLTDFNGDISDWDVSNVTDMTSMFKNSEFNGDISDWDVSNVEDMTAMFFGSKFNGDISDWDVSKVKNMDTMFFGSKFNGDISDWDVSKVVNMYGMFNNSPLHEIYGCTPDVDKTCHFVKR